MRARLPWAEERISPTAREISVPADNDLGSLTSMAAGVPSEGGNDGFTIASRDSYLPSVAPMAMLSLRFDSPDSVQDWKTVDDVVMGGQSSSRLEWRDVSLSDGGELEGALRFCGNVSLDGGGFCSARIEWPPRDYSGADTLELVARGDERTYRWTLRSEGIPRGASFRHAFEFEGDGWETVELPLEDFELWRRGTLLSADRDVEMRALTSVGVLIADRQAGAFDVEIAAVDLV